MLIGKPLTKIPWYSEMNGRAFINHMKGVITSPPLITNVARYIISNEAKTGGYILSIRDIKKSLVLKFWYLRAFLKNRKPDNMKKTPTGISPISNIALFNVWLSR
nr:hypothetical protein [Candidatus Symbiopectobacterium sp.]